MITKISKRLLTCVICAICMATSLSAQTNVLRADTVTTPSGKAVMLPIALENTSDITGVQFDVSVPYELAKDEQGNVAVELSRSRLSDFTVVSRYLGTENLVYYPNGVSAGGYRMTYYKYRIILYSNRNELVAEGRCSRCSLPLPWA